MIAGIIPCLRSLRENLLPVPLFFAGVTQLDLDLDCVRHVMPCFVRAKGRRSASELRRPRQPGRRKRAGNLPDRASGDYPFPFAVSQEEPGRFFRRIQVGPDSTEPIPPRRVCSSVKSIGLTRWWLKPADLDF